MAQKSSAIHQSIKHNHDPLSLSDAYTDHPILWLNPSIYSAQHQEYSSIQQAMRAYNKEKQLIICCYERQLQRLLSQFSIALKQIEYLETFRREQNKQNSLRHHHTSPVSPSASSIGYESMIEHLNRKIRIMHEEMVNIKNLYIKKMDFLSQQKSTQINDLQQEIAKLSHAAYHHEEDRKQYYDEEDIKEEAPQLQEERHAEMNNVSKHWKPHSRSVFKDDFNLPKLRDIQAKYDALCTEHRASQLEIARLRKGEDTAESDEDDDEMVQALKKQLKAAQFQQKLLLKKQRDEAFLKAKKKILMKEQRQMAEEEFKLRMEEVQINKDLVINRLAAEYHEMADKREEEQLQVEDLKDQINNLHETHESQLSQLKDEYVSRIHYHRKQIQEYVNTFLSKSREMNVNTAGNSADLYDGDGRRTSEEFVSNYMSSPPTVHVQNESEESMQSQHSRDDSLMSQISQSADEIVTSLVMGIDEKLDDLFTPNPAAVGAGAAAEDATTHPGRGYSLIDDNNVDVTIASKMVHNPRDTFTYLDYGITPRDTSIFQQMTFIDPDENSSDGGDDDDDDDEPEPEPQEAAVALTLPVMVGGGGRSNASLLFAKPPIINLISAEMSDAVTMKVKSTTHEELAQQCIEYEDTMTRYETEIAELRDTVDKMLMSHADQESEIKSLKDKNRKSKRKEFDWVTKEKEYKSLLAQYRELRENNAKLTLTYFTLQCEYDKLKRDYDEKSGMIMNYGDYQINLANQINIADDADGDDDDHPLLIEHDALDVDVPRDALDILSNCSDEDDEVDMVVGFMHRASVTPGVTPAVEDGPQMMHLNSSGSTASATQQQHNKQQLSAMSHGYNMSYWGNNIAFQYSAKTKDELIGDCLKLREKLSEMTDTKFSILQSTKQEIDRLTSKVKMFEERERNRQSVNNEEILEDNIQEIQLDQQISDHKGYKTEHKQRKSFDGVNIGIMSNDEHTYTVSRGNDLDSVAKQLASKQHQRAQSYASMASSRNYLSPTATTMQRLDPKIFDENEEDNDGDAMVGGDGDDEEEEEDADNTGHVKSLTAVLHNITESDEIKIE